MAKVISSSRLYYFFLSLISAERVVTAPQRLTRNLEGIAIVLVVQIPPRLWSKVSRGPFPFYLSVRQY
jgi:hypothetical protein